jgi:photosystem II stability/assembly factor-like uncharacterized protein
VRLTSGVTAGFNHISLVGHDTVYVSGDDMLRSTDAGITWEHLAKSPVGFPVGGWDLQFWDDTLGWAGLGDSVYRTTDGGFTWHPAWALGCQQLIFISQDSGWVRYDNKITRTTDGGLTWSGELPSFGGDFYCMAFADSKYGFCMGGSSSWHGKPDAAALEVTSDGGATWMTVYPGFISATDSGLTNATIYGVASSINNTIWAAGYYYYAGQRTGLTGVSHDGGNSWLRMKTTRDEEFFGIANSDTDHATAVGTSGLIMHTSDGGKSWQRQASPYPGDLKAVVFADTLMGYACGDQGAIIKTTNGGLSWVEIHPGVDSLRGSVFPNPASVNTSITYALSEPQHVTLTVEDVTGRCVRTVFDNVLQQPGIHHIPIDISKLPCGTYFIRFLSEKYYFVSKIVVTCS